MKIIRKEFLVVKKEDVSKSIYISLKKCLNTSVTTKYTDMPKVLGISAGITLISLLASIFHLYPLIDYRGAIIGTSILVIIYIIERRMEDVINLVKNARRYCSDKRGH